MNDVTTENKTGSKSALWITVAIIVLAGLAALGYFFLMPGDSMKEESSAVALVDGQAITESDYNRSTAQISGVYEAQGLDVSTGETASAIKDQALNTLINRQLVLNAAAAAGTSVSAEAVEAEYQSIVANMGGEENLSAAISANGVTLAQFREDLETDLTINTYLEEKLDTDSVVVTDEEVQATYDEAAANETAEIPPFEEVSDLIRQQLLNEKQQALISAELDRLRAEAEIEILI